MAFAVSPFCVVSGGGWGDKDRQNSALAPVECTEKNSAKKSRPPTIAVHLVLQRKVQIASVEAKLVFALGARPDEVTYMGSLVIAS